jgi:Arc/MetJ-type ribon-helix-helix transcriptional regulator
MQGILYTSIFNFQAQVGYRGIDLKLITLYLPETYIKALDQLVDECFYPNRAEAIRVAIRDMISEEVWRRKGVD